MPKRTDISSRLIDNQISNISNADREDEISSIQRDSFVDTKRNSLGRNHTNHDQSSFQKTLQEAEEQESEDLQEEHLKAKKKKQRRIIQIVLIIACIYVSYLIFGVFVTSYQYNDQGKVVPVVMSVSELKEKKDFDVILNQYIQCRSLYEKVLLLDYQYQNGTTEVQTLGPKYGELVEGKNEAYNCENLDLKLSALTVNDKYSSLKDAMLNWLENDMAVYLRDMSSGITNNLQSALVEANSTRDSSYYDFSNITSNILTLGKSIKGADIVSISTWTPENYVDEQINGKEDSA